MLYTPNIESLPNLLAQVKNITGKNFLIRMDLNIPIHKGRITDETRIIRNLKTISELVNKGAKLTIISHFGRPGGEYKKELSLAFLTDELARILSQHNIKTNVKFGVSCIGQAAASAKENLQEGEILLLENLRFHKEEEEGKEAFAKELAQGVDYYVNNAFSCSHRSHASIVCLPRLLKSAIGIEFAEEIAILKNMLQTPNKPLVAIASGSKISSKIGLLKTLVKSADYLLLAGGIANTFLHANGIQIGKSLHEKTAQPIVQEITAQAKRDNCQIMLPLDVVLARSLESFIKGDGEETIIEPITNIPPDMAILDVGMATINEWSSVIKRAKTLIWNGPLGAFEYAPFDVSSIALARIIATQTRAGCLKSIAGGGDVLSAIKKGHLQGQFSFLSTAGGAFLEWIQGKELPGLKALYRHNQLADSNHHQTG